MNFGGLHISVSESLVKLIVICSVNQFQMSSWYVFWVLLESSQLNVLYFEKLFNYFHYYKQFYYHLVRFVM